MKWNKFTYLILYYQKTSNLISKKLGTFIMWGPRQKQPRARHCQHTSIIPANVKGIPAVPKTLPKKGILMLQTSKAHLTECKHPDVISWGPGLSPWLVYLQRAPPQPTIQFSSLYLLCNRSSFTHSHKFCKHRCVGYANVVSIIKQFCRMFRCI